MSTAKCPRCADLVTLPNTNHPQARVQCPLCLEEFELGELLAKLPPPLIIVELPPGITLGRKGLSAGSGDSSELGLAENALLEPEGVLPSEHEPLEAALEERSLPASSGAWSISDSGEPTLIPQTDDEDELKLASNEDKPFRFGAPVGESGTASASISGASATSPVGLKGKTRPKRKERSPIFEIAKMVLGGVAGIVGANVLLWWLPFGYSKDMFDLGPKLSKIAAVRWAVPSKYWDASVATEKFKGSEEDAGDTKSKDNSKDKASKTNGSAGKDKQEKKTFPGNDAKSLQKLSEEAKAKDLSSLELNKDEGGFVGGLDSSEMPAEGPSLDVGEKPADGAPEANPGDEPAGEPSENKPASATEPADEPAKDPAKEEAPGEEKPATPDEPKPETEKPSAEPPADEPKPDEPKPEEPKSEEPSEKPAEPTAEPKPEEPTPEPAATADPMMAKLQQNIAAADTSLKAYTAATEAKDTEARRSTFRELYAALAESGVALSSLDPQSADVSAVLPGLQAILAELPVSNSVNKALNTMATKSLEQPAEGKGIALRGKVVDFRAIGEQFGTTVEMSPGVQVLVVTATNPQDQVKVGDGVQVVGTMVVDPAKSIAGFKGESSTVLRSNYWLKMELPQ